MTSADRTAYARTLADLRAALKTLTEVEESTFEFETAILEATESIEYHLATKGLRT